LLLFLIWSRENRRNFFFSLRQLILPTENGEIFAFLHVFDIKIHSK
jgi:hypothetical protein